MEDFLVLLTKWLDLRSMLELGDVDEVVEDIISSEKQSL